MGKRRIFRQWGIGLAATLITAVAALLVISGVLRSVSEQEKLLLLSSVRRAAAACYAVEGRYPLSLAYLEENYGLTYDKQTYIVNYDAFASNVMPDIDVSVRGKDGL